ncbi:MAG: KHG/KDPG aldolase/sugar kinase fusion protein [Eubacteriales bacterium]|nr:KHG/KDPG aldolase/sugar kinase fusion protein [Eubacteriales bacterium]
MAEVLDRIAECGILPVIKIEELDKAVPLAEALRKGGINAIEVTARNAIAFDAIRTIKTAFPDMAVGAGTIRSTELVDQAIAAGADYCVMPGFSKEVVGYCIEKGMPCVPGTTSPTEIEEASALGLTVLKFFPAEANGGAAALKLLNGPYPGIRWVPTGGVGFENIDKYLKLKCVAACGGSYMAKSDVIKAGDWDKITDECRRAVRIADQARGKAAPLCDRAQYAGKKADGSKIVGFGDLLVSLNPEGYRRFLQTDAFRVNYTGAEANVLASLSLFGLDTEFVTRLPDNPIAAAAAANMRKVGMGVDKIVYGGERIGVIYTERGASQRASKVVYDRKYTSIATAQPSDFDWDEIFADAGWFHFTGITAALSDSTAACCLAACKKAKEKGITISCDLNYRKNLWSEQKARSVMEELVSYVDILIANEEDADKVLGIRSADTDVETGKLNREGYVDVARQICEKFGVQKVGITLRRSLSASDNAWSAMLYDGKEAFFSREYMVHIVNRVGGGDSFTAGLIYALVNAYEPQKAIEFATAASCLKHSIEEDFNLVSVAEVEALAAGNGSGRVQR